MKVDSALLKIFLEGMHDGLREIYLVLKQGNLNEESLNSMARTAHRIKGEAAVVGVDALTQSIAKLEDIIEYHIAEAVYEPRHFVELKKQLKHISSVCKQISKKYRKASRTATSANDDDNSSFAEVLKILAENVSVSCDKSVEIDVSRYHAKSIPLGMQNKIQDIIIQLVRNAITHGIETPEARRAQDKSEAGKVEVIVTDKDKHLFVVVKDDGGGIDLESIRKRLINKYNLSVLKTAKLSAKALFASLFLPGFSTLTQRQQHAGRGVGLDLVKNRADKVGGKIKIDSEMGKFTNFIIKIPLEVAESSSVVSFEKAKKRFVNRIFPNIFSKLG